MKLTPILFSSDMHKTMEFYIPLGFEARDVMQEGDEIQSMKLIYRDNEKTAIIFQPKNKETDASTSNFILQIEEQEGDIEWHQVERYGNPKEETIKDPDGYQLKFLKN